jgi:hypothetical protein
MVSKPEDRPTATAIVQALGAILASYGVDLDPSSGKVPGSGSCSTPTTAGEAGAGSSTQVASGVKAEVNLHDNSMWRLPKSKEQD